MRKIINLNTNLKNSIGGISIRKISDPWASIGTILGQTSIDDYSFHLKKFKAKKGDIVAAEAKQPTGDGRVVEVIVWGRIMEIISSNEFLPNEAAKILVFKIQYCL